MTGVFARRVARPLRKNRLAELLDQKRAVASDVIDLTESNPTRAGFDYPEVEILAALSDPRSLSYEPAPFGLVQARQAVAAYYAYRGALVSPENIVLTASTSEAYAYLFKLLVNPGEAVLVPQPSYPLFDFLAAAESVELSPYRLESSDGWSIDFDSLSEAVGLDVRAVLVVSPNNPTGSFLKREEWLRLRRFCLDHELAVICDEVFADYALEADLPLFDPFAENEMLVFVLNGLSKVLGLPQLKLAWVLVLGPPHLCSEALGRLEIIADTFLSVGAPVQVACPRLLELRRTMQSRICERLRANLTSLQGQLAGAPIEVLRVEGGWYAVLRLPRIRTEEEWALELLSEWNTLAHPGYFFDFLEEPFLVVSLLTPCGRFQEGISRLLRMCL
jgi:aspartate/methionine/tyrosine aminotransferase